MSLSWRAATRLSSVAAIMAGALVLLPGVASAAFPGINGNIVFSSGRSPNPSQTSCPGGELELFSTPAFVTNPLLQPQLDCTSGARDQHVFVSPDGSKVVFASNRVSGSSSYELYTMPLVFDGSASGTPVDVSQILPANASDDYPSWAPASPSQQGAIVFARTLQGGLPQLYTENINVPGSVAPVFSSNTGFSDSQPVYDPSNANEIAFTRTASPNGPSQIFTYNFSTHALVPLSADNGDASSNDSKADFAPSPDSSGVELLIFQSDRTSPCPGTQLYTMSDQPPASGSTIEPVFQSSTNPLVQGCLYKGTGAAVATENPVFSPDGNDIAFDAINASQDVYAYTDDVANLGATDDDAPMSSAVDLTPNYVADEEPNWAPVQPGESTPEAPSTLLLPLVAVGAVGLGVLVTVHRRRRVAPRIQVET